MEYFAFILMFSAFSLGNVANASRTPDKKILFIGLVLIVTLFTGLRGIMDEYIRILNEITTLDVFLTTLNTEAIRRGYLFGLISSLILTLGGHIQTLYLVFAFTSIFLHAIYFSKFTKYYLVAFLIYMVHEMAIKEWMTIRAGLASATVLPCIYALHHNRKGRFLFWALVGGGIQYVGLLSVLIYWLRKEIRSVFLFIGLLAAIAISETGLVKELILHLDSLGVFPYAVTNYINWDGHNYKLSLFHPKIVQQTCVLLLALYLRNRMRPDLPYFHLILNVYFLSTISFILLSDLAIFSTRIAGHFYSVEPILIVYLGSFFVQKRVWLSLVCFASLLVAFINYVVLTRLEPYKMFMIPDF